MRFRLSGLTELTGEFDVYHQRVIFVLEVFSYLVAETKDRNFTKIYCHCQISHKRRKKECLGKFKFSLNRLKKQTLRKPIFVSASKGKVILI
jgi:hypothetical protein